MRYVRFGQGIVIAVADATHGRLDAGLGQALGVLDGQVLNGGLPCSAAAGVARATGDQHPEPRGDHVAPSGDVLGDPGQDAAPPEHRPPESRDDLLQPSDFLGEVGGLRARGSEQHLQRRLVGERCGPGVGVRG